MEYPSRSNLNCIFSFTRSSAKGGEFRFHSGLSTSVEWGKPLSIVLPPGIEPGFYPWKGYVLTDRRQEHFSFPICQRTFLFCCFLQQQYKLTTLFLICQIGTKKNPSFLEMGLQSLLDNIIPSPLWKYHPLLLVSRIWKWFSLNVVILFVI